MIMYFKKSLAKNGTKAMTFLPAANINNVEKIDFKQGLTFWGSILTFVLDLVTFDYLIKFFCFP